MIQLIEDKKPAIEALSRKYRLARLEIFGSAVDDTFDPQRSDVDFLVEFLPGADLGPWLSGYFELKQGLEDLLGFRVDLVETSALRNPYFIQEVNRTRRLLYAA